MPRPHRLRKISNPPSISGFKPYGARKNHVKSEDIFLHLEEYEAIRLCDYEMLNHHQAAVIMNVSRPTLTRIYEQARQKMARALVTGSQIIIEGGKIYFDSEWYSCHNCGCYFNNPEKQNEIRACPLCKSSDIANYEQGIVSDEGSPSRCSDLCVCIACGLEQPHHFGRRCRDEICPECGGKMTRKVNYQSGNI